MNKAGKKIVILNSIWDFQRSIQECIFRPSSPRSFGMRGIGAVPHLYSALQTCAMTKCVARGFTLIELLVVVLIIGILAAVALPQYQKAVMKSRYNSLMPIAKSIANGNEAYYMEHGTYATSPVSLDVAGQKNYPDGTTLDVYPNGTTAADVDYNYVIASRDNNFPLNYLVYQNHSPKFAGHIHCEADENNTMAQEVCQSLGGQYLDGSQSEGYLTYVLSGTVEDNDRLPSSLTKLAKKLCGANENCDYEINTQAGTVTLKDCYEEEANSVYSESSWCTLHTYNDKETLLTTQHTQHYCTALPPEGQSMTVDYTCSDRTNTDGVVEEVSTTCRKNYAKIVNGECLPNSYNAIYQTRTYSINGVAFQDNKTCKYQGCAQEYVVKNTRLSNGNWLQTGATCNGRSTADYTCNEYTGSVTFIMYDAQGTVIQRKEGCDPNKSDFTTGTC